MDEPRPPEARNPGPRSHQSLKGVCHPTSRVTARYTPNWRARNWSYSRPSSRAVGMWTYATWALSAPHRGSISTRTLRILMPNAQQPRYAHCAYQRTSPASRPPMRHKAGATAKRPGAFPTDRSSQSHTAVNGDPCESMTYSRLRYAALRRGCSFQGWTPRPSVIQPVAR